MENTPEKKKSFEEAMLELESIVSKLEKGSLTLDESIAAFQQGIELTKYCNAILEEMEKKITILQEKDGILIEKEVTDEFQR
jgi:exodeoxyribonuclease VII small subunit